MVHNFAYRTISSFQVKIFLWIPTVWSKLSKVGKVHPCTGRAAYRGSRGIALLFLDLGTRRGWGISVTPRPLFTPGKDPVPIVQEAGWTPWPIWTGAENLAPTGIRSQDRPARSQSLYRLSYRPNLIFHKISNIQKEPLYKRSLGRPNTSQCKIASGFDLNVGAGNLVECTSIVSDKV